jgi:nicotinate phosphoribosyltransferase
LHEQQAPIDIFGVGTELITGKPDAALDGVYKLAQLDKELKMKFSENIEKNTLPGKKKLIRYFDNDGKFYRDGILCPHENAKTVSTLFHPVYPDKQTKISGLPVEELQFKVMENGKMLLNKKTPAQIHEYLEKRANLIPEEHKRFISPHIYKVGISTELMLSRNALTEELKTLH